MLGRPICVIKIGSAVIATSSGSLDVEFLRDLCSQIANLIRNGWAPLVVSSGAKITGRAVLRAYGERIAGFTDERRALSAVGQSQLISTYANYLGQCEPILVPAQILLTRPGLGDRDRYIAIRDSLLDMLRNRIVPIVNSNDATNSYYIDFFDNDQIAAYVAGMLEASQVVILSDAGGVYDANPKISLRAKIIRHLPPNESQWPAITVDDTVSSFGGMTSKIEALRLLGTLGIPARVVGKEESNAVIRSVYEPASDFGTRLDVAPVAPLDNYKRWLCTGALPRGMLLLSDPGAERLSRNAGSGKSISVLRIGIIGHHGAFERGDAVTIRSNDYELVGIGRVRCGARELQAATKEKSTIVIHADEMLSAIRTSYLMVDDRQAVVAYYRRMLDQGYNIRENKVGYGDENKGGIIRIGMKEPGRKGAGDVCYRDGEARRVWQETVRASRRLGVRPEEWLLFRCLR